MRRADAPITQDIVLVGGGHAHALVLKRWAMRPLAGARLTLVNPEPTAPYTGMLPGFVAGHYPRAALSIDLVRLARLAGARLVLDRATGLDRETRRLTLSARPPIGYDLVSINVGVTSQPAGIPGAEAHAIAAKPLGAFADAWTRYLSAVAAGAAAPRAAVVGGGIGGVELAMAMAWRLAGVAPDAGGAPSVTLIEAAPELMPGVAAAARRRLSKRLDALGVRVLAGAPAAAIDATGVALAGGGRVSADFVAAAAGARPAPWLAETGPAPEHGFVRADPTLRSVGDPRVFAAGDAAHLEAAPRAKAGVYAVRQAPALADNLARAASGRPLRRHRPQGDYLKLISTGARAAVAEKWGIALWSPWFWRWKDAIDRAFMERLNAPPRPQPPPRAPGPEATGVAELRAGEPLCGGCGSKIGPRALSEGLSRLGPPRRSDVARAPGADAALVTLGAARLALSVDQFRAFVEDPYELGRIAALHALGDVWAMGGAPQAALASVILPPMSPEKQAATLAEILAGAEAALGPAGADLAGGHTASGAELSVGFSVTGLAPRPLGLTGARPGDALILTKPIGVGVILAAEMRGLCPGAVWAGALEIMRRSNGPAAAALRDRARAMTDVTGFGLAGHLLGLARASGVAADLDLDAVPLAPGAEALAAEGVRSSVAAENRAAAAAELGLEADGPRAALLFDPQTSGGLLAAVPEALVDQTLAALRAAGEKAEPYGQNQGRTRNQAQDRDQDLDPDRGRDGERGPAWVIGRVRSDRADAPRLRVAGGGPAARSPGGASGAYSAAVAEGGRASPAVSTSAAIASAARS